MILVDTSPWLKFDRATGSSVDTRLTELIATTDEVAVSEPVIMQVVAGARDDRRENDLRRLMDRFPRLRFDAAVDFDGDAEVYRACRRAGVTPRGTVDCMITAVAGRYEASLLAADSDLDTHPVEPPNGDARRRSRRQTDDCSPQSVIRRRVVTCPRW